MSPGDGRSHAWLSRKKGEPGEPFLPKVGEMYRVSTMIYSSCDPAADRPVVVVTVPPPTASHSFIQIVTRTSQLHVPGVRHPADRSLQCDKDGVFSDFTSVQQQMWRPEFVEYVGILGEPYLGRVLERSA